MITLRPHGDRKSTMKISTIAIIALFAANAQGFSVTMMSSLGYLDKLNGASWSSPSWTPAPSPMPYSAPSYSAPSYGSPTPAPAPATYRSIHADAPANSDLNYLKTLGGGATMKSGRNYSGVSSYFRQTRSGSSYLDALKDAVMAPASYSAPSYSAPTPSYAAPTPSYDPTPSYSYGSSSAPAPANGSYLDNLGGSSSFGSSSYGSKPSSGRGAFGSYLDSL